MLRILEQIKNNLSKVFINSRILLIGQEDLIIFEDTRNYITHYTWSDKIINYLVKIDDL